MNVVHLTGYFNLHSLKDLLLMFIDLATIEYCFKVLNDILGVHSHIIYFQICKHL